MRTLLTVLAVTIFPAVHALAQKPSLAPLPPPAAPPPASQVELGKLLFFDGRLSGDATLSCSKCHDPAKSWTDGLPLSIGYPGALYFRNTPSVINAGLTRYVYWDGRLSGQDLPTLVRDHIAEAHFMQADGRLIIERLRQVPRYENGFKAAFGGEPTYGRILKAVTAFLATVRSTEAPIDRHLNGDEQAISEPARRGLDLFTGKAGCVRCHHGPLLTDNAHHHLGLETPREIFATPERHITFRRFFRTLGVSQYASLREDIGLAALTKRPKDRGKFRTPSLREVARTAPYMHNGSLATLADVVKFYDRGGGSAANKEPGLKPLDLSDQEKSDLVEFLKTLSGKPMEVAPVTLPPYKIRKLREE